MSNFEKEFGSARETFMNLIENLDSEDFYRLYELFFCRFRLGPNEEIMSFQEISDLKGLKVVHRCTYEEDFLSDSEIRSGCIIIMVDFNGNHIVLDGNHRINTYMSSRPNLKTNVVLVPIRSFKKAPEVNLYPPIS